MTKLPAKKLCVCVEHLNRCKTSHPYYHSRGMERTYEAPSNEAPHMILGYHWGRSVTYLQFSNFLSNGNRLSLQPDTRFQLRVRLPQSALWIYSTGSSFSPFQNSLLHHWWVFRRWSLFYLSHLHLENSDDYFEEDSLVSKTSLIMFAWDSVPYRSYDGSFFV